MIKTRQAEKKRNAVLRFFDKVAKGARSFRDTVLMFGGKTNFGLATDNVKDLTRDKKNSN